MKSIFLCLTIVPLVAACHFSYHHDISTTRSSSSFTTSTSITNGGVDREEYSKTIKKRNSAEECTYTYKKNDYGYALKSNGPLKIVNGVLQKLKDGQTVDLKVTENGQEYQYTISKGPDTIVLIKADGTMMPDDKARVKKALTGVEKQASN
jgi:hypothetical protein